MSAHDCMAVLRGCLARNRRFRNTKKNTCFCYVSGYETVLSGGRWPRPPQNTAKHRFVGTVVVARALRLLAPTDGRKPSVATVP